MQGVNIGFLQLTGWFLVPVGDNSFFSISLPFLQLTHTFAWFYWYLSSSLCNTALKHFLQKVAECMAAVICIFEECFQYLLQWTSLL